MTGITDVRDAAALPERARGYAGEIGKRAGVPVSMMGVGPRREQLVGLA